MAGGPQTCVGPNYYGRDLHAIDRKGRVNIPARHRRVGSRNGTLAFWLSLDPKGCVFVGDAQRFMEHVSSRAGQAPNVEGAGRVRRNIFSNTARVEPDQQGRILIPAYVRTAAELEFQVLVLGVEDHLELWNPHTYEAYEKGSGTSLAETTCKHAGEDPRRTVYRLHEATRRITSLIADVVHARVSKIKRDRDSGDLNEPRPPDRARRHAQGDRCIVAHVRHPHSRGRAISPS